MGKYTNHLVCLKNVSASKPYKKKNISNRNYRGKKTESLYTRDVSEISVFLTDTTQKVKLKILKPDR